MVKVELHIAKRHWVKQVSSGCFLILRRNDVGQKQSCIATSRTLDYAQLVAEALNENDVPVSYRS